MFVWVKNRNESFFATELNGKRLKWYGIFSLFNTSIDMSSILENKLKINIMKNISIYSYVHRRSWINSQKLQQFRAAKAIWVYVWMRWPSMSRFGTEHTKHFPNRPKRMSENTLHSLLNHLNLTQNTLNWKWQIPFSSIRWWIGQLDTHKAKSALV